MEIVGGVLLVLLFSAVFGAHMLAFLAMWRGFRDEWRHYPAESRRRGIVGGVLAGVGLAVCGGLVIAEPWGHYSIVYVIGLYVGTVAVLTLSAAAAPAVLNRRRAPRLRAQRREAGTSRRDASDKGGER